MYPCYPQGNLPAHLISMDGYNMWWDGFPYEKIGILHTLGSNDLRQKKHIYYPICSTNGISNQLPSHYLNMMGELLYINHMEVSWVIGGPLVIIHFWDFPPKDHPAIGVFLFWETPKNKLWDFNRVNLGPNLGPNLHDMDGWMDGWYFFGIHELHLMLQL